MKVEKSYAIFETPAETMGRETRPRSSIAPLIGPPKALPMLLKMFVTAYEYTRSYLSKSSDMKACLVGTSI